MEENIAELHENFNKRLLKIEADIEVNQARLNTLWAELIKMQKYFIEKNGKIEKRLDELDTRKVFDALDEASIEDTF